MSKVFLIGNGESRKDFDLSLLKPHGKLYGCNAIYRDHADLLDVLTAVDGGMIHEVYHSGIAQKIPCYFREWTKVPAMLYQSIVEGMASIQDLKDVKDFDLVKDNGKGDSIEFVTHGSTINGVVTILKRAKDQGGDRERIKKKVHNAHVYVSWIKQPDKSYDIRECEPDGVDNGWACGPTTGYIASKLEKPDEIYMLGHDLVSDTNTVNNIYKSTDNYVASEFEPTPSGNWELQWKRLMELNPKIKFYKVNKELNDSPTNRKIDVFTAQEDINLEYISQAQLLDKMNKW